MQLATRFRNLGLSSKLIAFTVVIISVVAAVNLYLFLGRYEEDATEALVEKASAFTAVADAAKNHVSKLQKDHVFASDELLAEVKEAVAARRPYEETRMFGTIPVVAGWSAAAEAAEREGIEFHVQALEARNPANEPKPGTFEHQMISDLETHARGGDKSPIHRVNEEANTLHVMSPIFLEDSCMVCHGDPKTSPTHDGKDVLGFPMENWDPGDMHGAYEVVFPLAPLDARLARISTVFLMLTGGLVLAGSFAFLVTLRRILTRPVASVVTILEDIAMGEGDLTKRIEVDRTDEIGLLAKWFNTFVTKIEDVVREVRSGTAEIDTGTSQVSAASQSLAEGASEQAANLEQISSSLEQLSAMTQQNAESARQANVLAEEAKLSAERGKSETSEMSVAMGRIKESAEEVSKIIRVIDEIAFQTNLLALNAAVEAARAGEAGKGFAVVAEEVRRLAQRSAEAARSTSAMIEESTRRAEHGGLIAERVAQSLVEISSGTNKVNVLLSEIANATKEQATGISQVNAGTSHLDKVTQMNAGNSEELASAAEETAAQVVAMQELVQRFKVSAGSRAA